MKAEKYNKVVKTEARYTLAGLTDLELIMVLTGLRKLDTKENAEVLEAMIETVGDLFEEPARG